MSHAPILVTGSTDGIGRATAAALLRAGRSVVVHGRTQQKATRVAEELAPDAKGGATVEAVGFELSSLAAVRRGADELAGRVGRLSVLLHNAGVYETSRVVTEDGFERTLAVNHLSTVLLTELLAPNLLAAAPARVVFVSSVAHVRGRIDPEDFTLQRGFDPYGAYAASKLCNRLFCRALARRQPASALAVHALHPGVIDTKLLRTGFTARGAPVEQGARTSVRCAIAPELQEVTGRYFADEREERPSSLALDDALAERLYEASRRAVGLAP